MTKINFHYTSVLFNKPLQLQGLSGGDFIWWVCNLGSSPIHLRQISEIIVYFIKVVSPPLKYRMWYDEYTEKLSF